MYDIANIRLDLRLVRTNLAPRTIMRGPGFLNSCMIIEEVLHLDSCCLFYFSFQKAKYKAITSTVV